MNLKYSPIIYISYYSSSKKRLLAKWQGAKGNEGKTNCRERERAGEISPVGLLLREAAKPYS